MRQHLETPLLNKVWWTERYKRTLPAQQIHLRNGCRAEGND